MPSWQGRGLVTKYIRVADDWKCLDGSPIKQIRWVGTYPGWMNSATSKIDPPPDVPSSFILRMYEYEAGSPSGKPGNLIAEEVCSSYSQDWKGFILLWSNPSSYQHLFSYECNLSTPWVQEEGKTYFISIMASFSSVQPEYEWAWLNACSFHWNDDALRKQNSEGEWIELVWPSGHRLEGQSMDMRFELWTRGPTPTPTRYAIRLQLVFKDSKAWW